MSLDTLLARFEAQRAATVGPEAASYRQTRRDWVRDVVIDPATGRPRIGPVTLDRHDAAALLRDLPLLTNPEADL